MSETTTTPHNNIPRASDIQKEGGQSAWRFANGMMVRGEEIVETVTLSDGSTRETKTGRYPDMRKEIVGALRRIGFYTGDGKFGRVHRLEADIETADGVERVYANLLDPSGNVKVGVSAVNFAWCLLQMAKDEIVMIETAQGDPVKLPNGTQGGRPTYVNGYKVQDGKALRFYRPRRDPNAPRVSMETQFEEMETELRSHPAYEEREFKSGHQDGDDASEARAVLDTFAARGFEVPEDRTLAIWISRAYPDPLKGVIYDRLKDIPEDVLLGFRSWLANPGLCHANPVPKAAAAPAAPAAPAADPYAPAI